MAIRYSYAAHAAFAATLYAAAEPAVYAASQADAYMEQF